MNHYTFFLKKNLHIFLVVMTFFGGYILVRCLGYERIDFMRFYNRTYNEIRFIMPYVFFFLLCLLPVIKKIFVGELLVRKTNKWEYMIKIYKEIFVLSVIYTLILTVGWYLVLGTGTYNWQTKDVIVHMSIIVIAQVLGWTMIGLLELFVYAIVKNLAFSFVISFVFFVTTNLSSLVYNYERPDSSVRLFDFMFRFTEYKNLFLMMSTGAFYVTICMGLLWGVYFLILRHDFVFGGKKVNEQ